LRAIACNFGSPAKASPGFVALSMAPKPTTPTRALRIVAIWQRNMANRHRVIKLSRLRNGTVPNPA